ncbi:MAG TPA: sugar O-acetyltransferase [Kiritimatiellia bacterium]|nr:sugar O-acetyltransferase [Kiritimatiellia bacterium]
MKTERGKMLAGALYNALDPELSAMRQKARLLCHALNQSRDDEVERRTALLKELFGIDDHLPWLEPPFYCDYGVNIKLGERVFFNFNCVVLDVAEVTIGDRVLFASNVQLYTATHPVHPEDRASGLEFGQPIRIGSDVWVGGGAIVCPGVTIGEGSVIGAGSVVTRDIPANVVAVGNPCRVLRPITDADRMRVRHEMT